MRLTVYIPVDGHYTPIAETSGVVGTTTRDADRNPTGSVLVDYEANLYGAANIITWADRVAHAASRHVHRYPTSARSLLPEDAVLAIGSYDVDRQEVTLDPGVEGRLANWIGVLPTLLAPELRVTAGIRWVTR